MCLRWRWRSPATSIRSIICACSNICRARSAWTTPPKTCGTGTGSRKDWPRWRRWRGPRPGPSCSAMPRRSRTSAWFRSFTMRGAFLCRLPPIRPCAGPTRRPVPMRRSPPPTLTDRSIEMNRVETINRGMEQVHALTEVEIPDMKGKVSDEEWAIRVDLAAAYRLVAHFGWDDLVFTHLSARIPGPEHHFLLNPYQLMFEEVTASSLVKVDVHGNPVEPSPFITNPAGFTIHSAVHMARDDAHAVMHLHTPAGQAVSAHEEGLLPLTQTAMLIRQDLAFHDYEGVAVDLDERERIVADLGTRNSMILRNHGTLSVGKNVGECFIRLYYLERACQAQIMALSAGDQISNPPQGSPEITAQQGAIGLPLAANLLAWPALKRKAYRLDPSFAT